MSRIAHGQFLRPFFRIGCWLGDHFFLEAASKSVEGPFQKGVKKRGHGKCTDPVSGDNLKSDRRLPPPCNCAWLESSTYLLSWFDRRWQLPNGLLTFASWHVYDFCVTQLSQMIGSYVCAKKKGYCFFWLKILWKTNFIFIYFTPCLCGYATKMVAPFFVSAYVVKSFCSIYAFLLRVCNCSSI